jgi:hypothetical protein
MSLNSPSEGSFDAPARLPERSNRMARLARRNRALADTADNGCSGCEERTFMASGVPIDASAHLAASDGVESSSNLALSMS